MDSIERGMVDPYAKLGALSDLHPGRCVWLDLPCAATARIAALAGAEIAVVDREHGAIGLETAASMIGALKAEGAAALVRVPERGAMAQALDAGASGIVLPGVETVAMAEAAVAAFYYPPHGRRGAAASVIAATGYGTDRDYAARWNGEGLLAVQIESRAGLEEARAIAAVPGVDMLFFGPYDFAMDAGLDPEADATRLAEAFGAVVAAARGEGRLAGVFPWPGATPEKLSAAGADLVVRASDVVALRSALAAALA